MGKSSGSEKPKVVNAAHDKSCGMIDELNVSVLNLVAK